MLSKSQAAPSHPHTEMLVFIEILNYILQVEAFEKLRGAVIVVIEITAPFSCQKWVNDIKEVLFTVPRVFMRAFERVRPTIIM